MFKTFDLKKSAVGNLNILVAEFTDEEISPSMKSLVPGEWVVLRDQYNKKLFLGFTNNQIEAPKHSIHAVMEFKRAPKDADVKTFLQVKLTQARERRLAFAGYEAGSRIFYGVSDGIPGLIIDEFVEIVLIQINTAGPDLYRDYIHEVISDLTKKKVFLLDNPKYREREKLPSFERPALPDRIKIQEGDIKYELPAALLQKVGFYYDHRENRKRAMQWIDRSHLSLNEGVDLFSYLGAWGMSALKSKVKNMLFVDQAPLGEVIEKNLELNKLKGRGSFLRKDVFDYLDQAIVENKKFDFICSDPPAFAKTKMQKKNAIDGYNKLHRRIFKMTNEKALVVFASCTHYVGLEEFIQTIQDGAYREHKKIQLIDIGIQGIDHPIHSLDDRGNYIKYCLYQVENL